MALNGSGFGAQPLQAITPPRPPHMRQRARKACVPCRQRKRKCDVQIPCTMCTTYGYECRYSEHGTSPTSHIRQAGSDPSISPNDVPESNIQHINKKAKLTGQGDETQPRSTLAVVDQGILDPFKSRYMKQHSAVAFPRSLGLALQSANPPPLHSFAWNCGIRPEEGTSIRTNILDLVSCEEFAQFSDVYFSTVHPVFGVLDRKYFLRRCDDFWLNRISSLELGALIGSVVALGSFFSFRQGHPRESEIVQHVKAVLEDPTVSRRPSMDQINAWILRTLYLRGTTRPHVAWLASTMTLHLAEATGLHHEVQSVHLTTENTVQPVEPDEAGAEQARRSFWVSHSINTIMSYEYGRSKRTFSSISCKPIKPVEGDFTAQHILLAQIIPEENATSDSAQAEDLQRALKQLQQIPGENSFMCLVKADVCFCFYRRLRLLKQGLEKELVHCVIDNGNRAVAAASELAQKGCPWWNILGTVFQYFCVLLAMDTSESLSNVSSVLENLEEIVQVLGTHLALEALETARVLLRDSMAKKRRELALLETADGGNIPGHGNEVDINWDALLDPSYSEVLLSQDFSLY